jgi:adenylate cyclase
MASAAAPPESLVIDQEVDLGLPGSFADIRIAAPNEPPYFIEVKYGYPPSKIVEHVGRKYGQDSAALRGATKVVVVVASRDRRELSGLERELRERVHSGLAVELWGEETLLSLVNEAFGLKIDSFESRDIIDLRQAADGSKGRYAFGEAYSNDPLQAALLWHLGFWRIRQLRESRGLSPREILSPGIYAGAVVIFADLSSFSSYVRDTRDDSVIRHILMTFYSKTRSAVLNRGGMMYQFLGDGAIGIFGLPELQPSSARDALDCARSIIDIGNSVSNEWQRNIDQVQKSGGAHIGLALGDLNILSQRPFGRAHMAVIGESVNLAARLTNVAGPGEIVVSNALLNAFPEEWHGRFLELEPVEAHNMGRIKAWKLAEGEGR